MVHFECPFGTIPAIIIKRPTANRLSQEIDDLKSLNTAQLRERWRTLLGGRRTFSRLAAVASPGFGVDSLTLTNAVMKRPSFPVN
jgi:hypothetical protein